MVVRKMAAENSKRWRVGDGWKLAMLTTAWMMMCGCGRASANGPPAATGARLAEIDDARDGLREHHRYHHHGGTTLFIAMALDSLGVSLEQRPAAMRFSTELRARMEPARVAEEGLVMTLADGVAGANFDETSIDSSIAQVAAAAATAHDASADTLNQLHALLTPAQRDALVDKVESHWTVWQRENGEENNPQDPERRRLAMLVADLGLTQNQVDTIQTKLDDRMKTVPRFDPQEVTAYLREFGASFRGENFDAKTLTAGNGANAHIAGWGAVHLARFVETTSPLLTFEQRVQFAQKLREHASHNQSNGGTP